MSRGLGYDFKQNSSLFLAYKKDFLKGVPGLVGINPFIKIVYIQVNPLAHLYAGQATGPDKLTEGRHGTAQVNGSLWNGKEPLSKGFTLGILNPVRLCNCLFFQSLFTLCALTVPRFNTLV